MLIEYIIKKKKNLAVCLLSWKWRQEERKKEEIEGRLDV